MKQYRIKEYSHYKHKSYVVQKKSMFGFWYNPDNIDGCITGVYDTLEEAQDSVRGKCHTVTSRLVPLL